MCTTVESEPRIVFEDTAGNAVEIAVRAAGFYYDIINFSLR